MQTPFAELAESARDMARWERQRIEITQYLAITGQCQEPGLVSRGGWTKRASHLEVVAQVLDVLSGHERDVRALDSALFRPEQGPPSLWRRLNLKMSFAR